nr:transglutaminase family protein [Acanthopleuribacter pedis]
MKQFLDEHVGHVKNPGARLNRLIWVVFNNEFLNLTYENTNTKTAAETFEERSGNCLSFTNMFVAMSRYLGFKVAFQEVSNVPTWDKHGNVVVLNRHMNAIVFLGGRQFPVDFNPDAVVDDRTSRIVSDRRALAQYYNNIAAEKFGQGKRHEALAWFKKAVEIDGKISFAWSNLGVAHQYTGNPDKAEACYKKALRVSRMEMTAMNNLERLYSKTGREELAEKYRHKVMRFREKNPFYQYDQGRKAFDRGAYQEAVTRFRKAIYRKPKTHEFHHMLAAAYHKLGKDAKAARSLREARGLAPDVFNKDRYSQKLETLAKK